MDVLSLNSARRDKHRNGVRAQKRLEGIPHFIGVDGEGVTLPSGEHRYVLLGVGDQQIENPDGLRYNEILSHLYSQFEENRTSSFVGFFLGYDFSYWIKNLPQERAWSLLTSEGISRRTRKLSGGNTVPFPVRHGAWEFDMLGMRRFKLRPQCCDEPWKCKHKGAAWMYICDTGPFWQTSLMSAIDPGRWEDPIVSQDEYDDLKTGKDRRSEAVLDDEMRRYNALENDVLTRLMGRQAQGLIKMGVRLSKDQWHGPGQASAEWMRQQGVPRRKDTKSDVVMLEASRRSYFGGWFELFAHGLIPGTSYGYDINSAYPYIMSRLPCLEHGEYNKGIQNPPDDNRSLVLIEGIVHGHSPYIGAMLHRTPQSNICRPSSSRGTFWLHELKAAQRAGLVKSWTVTRWYQYIPCECAPPLRNLAELYRYRLSVGKDSAAGKAAKLIYNSAYGKFAQSVGSAPYGNWIYASLITAGCRTMICDAIATHPLGAMGCLMVATDAVYFLIPHPGLPLSKELGEWDESVKEDLFLFKPGFYWDRVTKDKITYRSRGIRAADFAGQIPRIEEQFKLITKFAIKKAATYKPPAWPLASFTSGFSMLTPLQALHQNKWDNVANITTDRKLIQSSDPENKRVPLCDIDNYGSRKFLRTPVYDVAPGGIKSRPYDKDYADANSKQFEDISPDGGTVQEWNFATQPLREG